MQLVVTWLDKRQSSSQPGDPCYHKSIWDQEAGENFSTGSRRKGKFGNSRSKAGFPEPPGTSESSVCSHWKRYHVNTKRNIAISAPSLLWYCSCRRSRWLVCTALCLLAVWVYSHQTAGKPTLHRTTPRFPPLQALLCFLLGWLWHWDAETFYICHWAKGGRNRRDACTCFFWEWLENHRVAWGLGPLEY